MLPPLDLSRINSIHEVKHPCGRVSRQYRITRDDLVREIERLRAELESRDV